MTHTEAMNKILTQIINEIKESNANSSALMSEEPSNERILAILRNHDLDDDVDILENVFGLGGLQLIRDAEAGVY